MALNDEEESALRGELAGAQKALKEANKESSGHRLNADRAVKAAEAAEAERDAVKADAQAQIDAMKAEMTGKLAEADTTVTTTRSEAAQRVLRAELRAQATAAGMRDPDDLGALDTSEAALGEDGKVKLPDGYFAKMKEAKPYLFGAVAVSTGSTATPPKTEPGAVKKFADMNADEQTAWKRANGIPR